MTGVDNCMRSLTNFKVLQGFHDLVHLNLPAKPQYLSSHKALLLLYLPRAVTRDARLSSVSGSILIQTQLISRIDGGTAAEQRDSCTATVLFVLGSSASRCRSSFGATQEDGEVPRQSVSSAGLTFRLTTFNRWDRVLQADRLVEEQQSNKNATEAYVSARA